MKVLILYRPNSEHDTLVQRFVRDFMHRTSREVELVSLDTRDGAATASLYDVLQYPAVLVVENHGSVQQLWQGEQLPLIDEVSYFLGSGTSF